MALTIGLFVWVFQAQAELDKKVYKDYIDIRKYDHFTHYMVDFAHSHDDCCCLLCATPWRLLMAALCSTMIAAVHPVCLRWH